MNFHIQSLPRVVVVIVSAAAAVALYFCLWCCVVRRLVTHSLSLVRWGVMPAAPSIVYRSSTQTVYGIHAWSYHPIRSESSIDRSMWLAVVVVAALSCVVLVWVSLVRTLVPPIVI